MKDAFKLSAIINIVVALLCYTVFNSIFYSILLIVLSVVYLNCLEKDSINKSNVILLSLINLVLNPLSGIIMLVSTDKITDESKKNVKEPKQKIEMPLNLGVALISLSGIILATTNLEFINNITKILLLFSIGIIFIVLSNVLEIRLNIKNLSKKYFILGNIFIILSVIANGYLGVMSHWFSFTGSGKNLYLAFISIIISLLSQILYKKYDEEMYKHLTYIGIFLSIAFILIQLKISVGLILIVVNVVLFILHLRNLDNYNEYAKYLTYTLCLVSLFVLLDSSSVVELIILGVFSIINVLFVTFKNNTLDGILGAIFINALTLITVNSIDLDFQILSIIIGVMYSIYYLFNLIGNSNRIFNILMNISSNIVFVIYLLVNIDNSLVLILISILMVLTSLINYYNNSIKYESILLPVKISVLGLSLVSLVNTELLNINYILIALYLTALFVYLISKESTKLISKIVFYIILCISIIVNDAYLIPSMIDIVTALVFYLVEKNKFSYIVFLFTILMSLTYTNILNTTVLVSSILLFLIYVLLTLFTFDNNKINKINYLSIILPLLLMTTDSKCLYDLRNIILNLIGMYIVLLINMFLIKNDKERNIAATVLTILLIIRVIFIHSWMIGLYVGVLGLIMILIGMFKKEYKGLYFEGFVITIINLIFQFNNILTELPLWLYLFLSGIVIIGIVTYRAVKDNEKK